MVQHVLEIRTDEGHQLLRLPTPTHSTLNIVGDVHGNPLAIRLARWLRATKITSEWHPATGGWPIDDDRRGKRINRKEGNLFDGREVMAIRSRVLRSRPDGLHSNQEGQELATVRNGRGGIGSGRMGCWMGYVS